MTAVTKPEPKEITTADLPHVIRTSAKARSTIAPFLPDGVSLERVAASLTVALEKDRAAWKKEGPAPLEKCSPMSVFMACAKAAQMGLEVGETAHLVPFGTECTLVADYKGLAQLVIGSGVIAKVEARCVYANETFEMLFGTTTQVRHAPIGHPAKRGDMIGAYAVFHYRAARIDPLVRYLSIEEIDEIRQRYSKQWKQGKCPAWYAEKTVVRQGVKLLPKDPRLAKTMAMFEEVERMELDGVPVPDALRELEAGETPAVAAPAAPRDPSWDLSDDEPATLDG